MSFVSSAFPSKQVAPKGPARRRPAIPAAKPVPAPTSGTSQTSPLDSTNEAESSAREGIPQISAKAAPSSPAPVVDNVVPVPLPIANPVARSPVLAVEGTTDLENVQHLVEKQSSGPPVVDAVAALVQTIPETGPSQSRKRTREAVDTPAVIEIGQVLSTKRPKRFSARSNDLVQAHVNEESVPVSSEPSPLTYPVPTAQAPRILRRRRSPAPAAIGDTALRAVEGSEVTERRSVGSKPVESLLNPRATRGATRPSSAQVAEIFNSSARPKRKEKQKRGGPVALSQNGEAEQPAAEEEGGTANATSVQSRRKSRKPRNASSHSDDQGGESNEAATVRTKRRRNRIDSDLELHEIDANSLSMYDLSRDDKRGKISTREKEMAKIDWNEVNQKRREDIRREAQLQLQRQRDKDKAKDRADTNDHDIPVEAGNDEEQSALSPRPPEDEEATVRPLASQGPMLRIVNGEIVADEASLTVQTAPAPDASAEAVLLVDEENDLTRRVNRLTHLNARKRDPAERVPVQRGPRDRWTDEETDRFFDLLWAFGTDFATIARYFAPRSRKQVKTKFTREERLDPDRVTDMLLHRGPRPSFLSSTGSITLEQYAADTNGDLAFYTKFESAKHADEVIKKSMAGRQEEALAAIAEEEEERRQRQLQKEMEENGKKEKAKQREQKRKEKSKYGGRKARNIGVGTLGGGLASAED